MKIFFSSLLLLAIAVYSKAQTTCATAITIDLHDSCQAGNSVTGSALWFDFAANGTSTAITIKTYGSDVGKAYKLYLYSGTCSGLSCIDSATGGATDSVLSISARSLSVSSTYYIRLVPSAGTHPVVDICMSPVSDDDPFCAMGVLPVNHPVPPLCELICNGDFESKWATPDDVGEVAVTDCWNKFEYDPASFPGSYICYTPNGGTPDYFNAAYTTSAGHCNSVDVPSNYAGTASSHSAGNGYAGIYTYAKRNLSSPSWIDPADPNYNYREYIQQKLNAPLIAGATYNISMYVNLSSNSAVATKVCIYLSNGPVYGYIGMLPFTPQYTTGIITGSGWQLVSFSYTVPVTGTAPDWIVIGNFLPDAVGNISVVASTATITSYIYGCSSPETVKAAYYYIDDVSITPAPFTVTASPSSICSGSSSTLSGISNPGEVYTWSPSGSLSCPVCSTTVAIPSASTTYTASVTYASGCTLTATTSVTVKPKPVITAEPNLAYCTGDNVPVNSFVSTPTGATFTWTNSNTAIGLAAGGTGAIPAFTANNTGTAAITATITVTPSLAGCTGTPLTFTITVNPRPAVSGVPGSSTICAGTSVAATSFSGTVAGTTYSWTNSNTSIGLGASGSGNVPSFTATNSTGSNISGTVTVTPSYAGCTGTPATYTITVKPTPSITSSEPNLTYCNGNGAAANSFTTSIAGSTITWTNSNTSIGLAASGSGTIPSFTATNTGTSAATATITVTPTLAGCTGSPAVYTITVNPTPAIGALFNREVCANTSVSVGAFTSNVAGTTYSWTNSNTAIGLAASGTGSLPVFTAANSTGSPVTGTITVTPVAAGCAGTPVSFNITVDPIPVLSVTPSSPTITIGGSTSLSVSGGTTYTWTPATGLSCTSCSNPTASPTATTTYTVSSMNSYQCAGTATVTVNVLTPCNVSVDYNLPDGTHSAAYFGTSVTISNKNILVNGVFTVDGTITFSGCNFIMAASGATNAKIDITGHTQLTMIEKTHVYSCGDMWDGIYIGSSALLTLTGYPIIEDAANAVVSQNGGNYNIESCVFNRNLMGIYVQSYAGTHPGYVRNAVFTSRAITTYPTPSSNPTVGDVKTNLTSYATANMKSPNSAFKGVYGIYATGVGNIKIGYDGLLSLPSSTGYSALNVFDAIMCGVNLVQTNATIYNNQFQYLLNPTVTSCFPGPCYNITGYGVNASGATTGTYSITIGGTANSYQGNSFNSIYRAIQVADYKTTSIIKNSITNASTAVSPAIGYGNVGIYVKPASANTITITDNAPVNNCATAIWINRAYTTAASTNSLQINNNGTYASPVTADASGYCTNGIYITDLTATPTTVPTAWEISGNVITETGNGIFLQNVKRPSAATSASLYTIAGNSCTVRYASTGALSGITAKGCAGLSIQQNHTKYNSTAGYTTGANLTAYGIYLENSTNMLVKCNQIDDAARSLTFYGTCTSTLNLTTPPYSGITQNTMHNAYDGFVLTQSGIIGTQGSSTVASNNYWDPGSTFTNSQTFTDNTTGSNTSSRLYMTNTASTFPVTNITNSGAGNQYISGTGLNTSSGSPVACGSVPALTMPHSHTRDFTTDSTRTHDLVVIAEDNTLLAAYSTAVHWQRKSFVYNEIRSDNTLTLDEDLNSFYTDNAATSFGELANVQDALSNENYTLAETTNENIVINNILEQNQQTVNRLLLLQLNDTAYTYTPADSSSLYAIAIQCPITGGNAVYQARNLLMSIENNILGFPEICDKQKQEETNKQDRSEKAVNAFRIFPNPNDGNMTFEYAIGATNHGTLQLMDYTGKLIANYALDANTNKLMITCTTLDNGIYFYRVSINNKIVGYDKLIIIK